MAPSVTLDVRSDVGSVSVTPLDRAGDLSAARSGAAWSSGLVDQVNEDSSGSFFSGWTSAHSYVVVSQRSVAEGDAIVAVGRGVIAVGAAGVGVFAAIIADAVARG